MIRLQRCTECGTAQYPARAVCVACLSDALAWEETEALPGTVLARAVLHHSNEAGFHAALPLAIALVRLDAGPVAVCFVGERVPGEAVRVRARVDDAGRLVLEAL